MESVFAGFYDQITSLEVNMTNSLFRMFVSMLLGMLVGAERKRKGQIAGVRTFALISMGACLAMILSVYVPQEYMGLKNGDPGRIAAQVITGIGFIGAGAIIQMKGSVRGLTTAAGIWITAIIGMAAGIGMYACAIGATAFILIVLVAFERFERFRDLAQESKVISITTANIINDCDGYRKALRKMGVHLSTYYMSYDFVNGKTEINFVVLVHAHKDLIPVLRRISEINPTDSITLSSQLDI